MERRQAREQKGMTSCTKSCTSCPYIKTGKKIRIKENSYWDINRKVNCQSYNVVYMLECDKENYQQRYIGKTGWNFKNRLDEHRGYINSKDES